MFKQNHTKKKEILFITSYPPRACGIATYSKDLIDAIQSKFDPSFSIKVCALDESESQIDYPKEVKYILKSSDLKRNKELAHKVNINKAIKMVFVQHEFGLFGGDYGEYLLQFLDLLKKPASVTFHTVLPNPDKKRKKIVQAIANACDSVVVMTNHSSSILKEEYAVSDSKISIIAHGTHIVLWKNKQLKKQERQLDERLVLSTFGLLSSNKNIETAIDALPKIVKQFPNALYLILGKTHPEVVKHEGEIYREFLQDKVNDLGLQNNVSFVDKYLSLPDLLDYLRLTDIYLFTSKDPHQAVSGTFAYAMSSACPVVSTPIPHALEMLNDNAGIIADFQDSDQFAEATIRLLEDDKLRDEMGQNAFHQTRNTVWENSAIDHAKLFIKNIGHEENLTYALPDIHLEHIHTLTDNVGMIQFSKICEPDINSGYTLDDNARAMISICMHYNLTKDKSDLNLIKTYLNFISYCQQPNGNFLNYVDKNEKFHLQNDLTNLEDSNGRAIWALGVLIDHHAVLPEAIVEKAKTILDGSFSILSQLESPRAIAFAIKGLYFYNKVERDELTLSLINNLADKILEKYKMASDTNWRWFESYLTYANSILPEAMLYAYLATNELAYKVIAHATFDFLLSHMFIDGKIKVVSNNGWHQKDSIPNTYGEQPIDVSYTIQALDLFRKVFSDDNYLQKMETAFSWYLGNNHLNQIIYNPHSGGCYDGLEEHSVNLNQGAESTVCYLIARLIIENTRKEKIKPIERKRSLVFTTRRSSYKPTTKKDNQVIQFQ